MASVFDPDVDLPGDGEEVDPDTGKLRAEDSPGAAAVRADTSLGPVDFGRRQSDERILVCEGACNPDIYDYDQLCVQMQGGNQFLMPDVAFRARRLRHTLHVRSRSEFWDVHRGWIRSFRCQVCGHVRKF